MKHRKMATLLAFVVVIVFPIVFLLYWMNKDQPGVTPLPMYGLQKKIMVEEGGEQVEKIVEHTIPDFKFVSHTGDTISRNSKFLRDKIYVADYFFSHCPGICVDMTSNLYKVQETFIEDHELAIVSFTVDPDRDSVQQLYSYAQDNEINSKKWMLLTGEKKPLYDLARNGFLVTATKGDGGPEDFIHSEKLVLIDREDHIRGFYDGTSDEDTEKLILDIKKLLVSYIIPKKEDS